MITNTKTGFLIPELELEKHIIQYVQDCDADELARLAGECFGGSCTAGNEWKKTEDYQFTPNQNYFGEFGEFVDPNEWKKERRFILKEARALCREILARPNVKFIRLVRWDEDSNGVRSINDIIEFSGGHFQKNYRYGSGIDFWLKKWCADKALFNFETVPFEIGSDHD